jgi:hypothetical protein
LFWWAPIWSVPSGGNQELAEHGWQLVWGNSFFAATVLFEAGVAVMLWIRGRQLDGTDPERGSTARSSTGELAPNRT